jgi:hypothetical protein
VFVFDSSAFINGAHHHYFVDTMRPIWALVEDAIADGRVIVPREVFREVLTQEDDMSKLLARHKASVVDPSQQVQRRAGEYQSRFFQSSGQLRDRADPWVMAEAEDRGFCVVTYEGITFAGGPARGADRKLPAFCLQVKIDCCTLAQALGRLGLNLT